MTQNDAEPGIAERAFAFALRIVKLVQALDAKPGPGRVIGSQLLRSGTSIGANVQEAQAGQSRRDFVAKLSIAQKEARETIYWLRLLGESQIIPNSRLDELHTEAQRINRILAKILLTTKARSQANS